MAILCSHCGQTLPSDDVRFCHNCGTLVPSHPFSPQSLGSSAKPSKQPVEPSENAVSELVEPAAQEELQPPAWMSALHKNERYDRALRGSNPDLLARTTVPVPLKPQERIAGMPDARPLRPEALQQTSIAEDVEQKKASQDADQEDFPSSVVAPVPRPRPPARELHVKIWEEEETTLLTNPAQAQTEKKTPQPIPANTVNQLVVDKKDSNVIPVRPTPVVPKRPPVGENNVDDLPTRPLAAMFSETAAKDVKDSFSFEEADQEKQENVEHLATIPLAAAQVPSPEKKPSPQQPGVIIVRGNTPYPSAPGLKDSQQPPYQPNQISLTPPPQPLYQPDSLTRPVASPPDPANGIIPQGADSTSTHMPSTRPRGRTPLFITLALLVLIVIIAIGSWVAVAQPFSIAAVTTPVLSFQDKGLGFSLLYPNKWTTSIDRGKSIAHFYDSSNTDQVDVSVANAPGGDLTPYLQQQASQLGLTAAKAGSPLSFAGASWQQIQGTAQVKGATYTEAILVTVHGSRLYTLTQLAPQVTYTDAESIIFAPLRASFHFI